MPISPLPLFPSSLAHLSSDMDVGDGPSDIGNNPSHHIENTVNAVAQAAGLSPQGRQVLLRSITWAIYASALDIRNPHLGQEAGWSAVLPIDPAACKNNLRVFLLNAGEAPVVARFAKDKFCEHGLIADFQNAFKTLHENSRLFHDSGDTRSGEAWREWMSRFLPMKDLPPHAIPFETLPQWARQTAIFATDMADRDCRGMPGLAGLDLRYLYAPRVNLENCDLRGTNFGMAYMPDAIWANAQTDGAILPE